MISLLYGQDTFSMQSFLPVDRCLKLRAWVVVMYWNISNKILQPEPRNTCIYRVKTYSCCSPIIRCCASIGGNNAVCLIFWKNIIWNIMYIQGASNSYDQNGHIIGVTGILEPAESTDVVPTIDPGTKISTGEGRGCKTRTIRAVSVEVGSPVIQSLNNRG